VSTHETQPPYILGNYPRAEIQFMCLDPNDPELSRPKLKKADTVIGRTVPSESTGTGFAISSNGFIVTAYHVVENATNIQVRFPSGRWVLAKPLKLSRTTDIAILKTDVTTSAHLYLADMTRVKQRQRVFTLGYPVSGVLGEEVKYTEGVISSLSGLQGEDSLMQITVPVQPGNSGGPLVNEAGEVVCIITSSAAISAFFRLTGTLPQNVNWAVKGNYILSLLNDKPKVENRDQPPDIVEMVKSAVVLIKTE
jgi:S1-C subfamily serine protease